MLVKRNLIKAFIAGAGFISLLLVLFFPSCAHAESGYVTAKTISIVYLDDLIERHEVIEEKIRRIQVLVPGVPEDINFNSTMKRNLLDTLQGIDEDIKKIKEIIIFLKRDLRKGNRSATEYPISEEKFDVLERVSHFAATTLAVFKRLEKKLIQQSAKYKL